jgi:hypothetical protein
MSYKQFKRFSLDPRNEREVLDLAITKAYQSSGGELNAFNAGSPLVTVLESLTSAHMEFLFWLNSLPEAMTLTFLAEALNANRNYGTKCQVNIQITLTQALSNNFILKQGTKIYSENNNNVFYNTESDLIITPGSTVGFVLASANEIGTDFIVQANELTVLGENFSYVLSVTNLASSTIGLNAETLEQVRDRVQTLMSQLTPVSKQDWLNVINLYFPNKAAECLIKDGILYLYIQDYSLNNTFETFVNKNITALQKSIIAPFKKATLQITIESSLNFDNNACIEITQDISRNLITFINKPLQPIDIYNNFANNFLTDKDVTNFDVLYYYEGLDPLLAQSIELQPFDFVGGQVIKDFNNNYYIINNSFNIVASPFDEAALGYLEYHPIYTTLGPGNYSSGDIVLVSNSYYLITSSGAFNPLNTSNWQLLPNPILWTNNLNLTSTDFIKKSGLIPGIDHGFIPLISYTTADDMPNNWASIFPTVVTEGASIAPGGYWSLLGLESVLYQNNTASNYVVEYSTAFLNQALVNILQKPDSNYSSLSRKSRFKIGQITEDNNKIIVDSKGATANIPTGLSLPINNTSIERFGTLIKNNDSIYEVIESFIPTLTDTINTLLASGFIKKAYKIYDDFEYLISSFSEPYYFDIELIYFKQQESKIVKKDGNNYIVVDL